MKLSIATKIFLAFSATIVVFGTVLVFGIIRTQRTLERVQAVNHSIVPLSLSLSDVQTDLKSFSLILNERDPLVLRRTLQVTRLAPSVPDRFRRRMTQTLELTSDSTLAAAVHPTFRQRVIELQAQIDDFAAKSQNFTELVLSDSPNEDNTAQLQTALREQVRRIDSELTALRAELRRATERSIQQANAFERSSLYTLAMSTAGALVVAILLLIAVSLTMRRLTLLTNAAKRIAQGDYSPLEVQPQAATDEIGALFHEFDAMARAIAERDIALREQHAKLIKSERLATIGQMTSLITHELRNPLSSINLNAEMIQDALIERDESDPELMEQLETIITEVDRLRDITEHYLLHARLPAPNPEQVNLHDLAENMIDFHTWEWLDKGVSVTLESPDSIEAWVDAGQVRQALLNLVKNAVEASPKDSEVFVRLKDEGDLVTIEIQDQAGGVPEELKEQLFEPFFTTKKSGTGLGLAMTQQIIEEHHGHITHHPVPDGTRFIISLPRSKP